MRRLALAVVLAAAAVALFPLTLWAAVAFGAAWLAGWPPRRLYATAAWCAPMVLTWLAAIALGMPGQPLWEAWRVLWRGQVQVTLVGTAPVAVPLGLLLGGLAWSRRLFAMGAAATGRSPAAAPAFDQRQWRRQVRSAKARIAAPGALPLLSHNGVLITGSVIRTVRHPARPVAYLPYERLRAHQVVIGTSGTGKTTLMLRLWAGFMAGGVRRRTHPLLVVIDCKGGASSRKVADRTRRVMRDAGARSTAVWPDEASLSLWALPPRQLITTLLDLFEHGSGAAAFYRDIMEAIVAAAVDAPSGPPTGFADFVQRLDPDWLVSVGQLHPPPSRQQVADVALRFRALWRRLGAGLDGPGGFADADAWYLIVEGTAETAVAEAQARALVDMLATYVAGSPGREVLLAVDEFSAVSRRLPIWELYERARTLGLALQVTSQSWEGLAAGDDERYRIAGTADGGIWLLRTPHPEPVCALAGSRRLLDTARSLAGPARWDETGTSRLAPSPVLDPDLVRQLDVGQAAYIYRGGVTFVQVKRLIAHQAALTPPPPPPPAPAPHVPSSPHPAPAPPGPPQSAPLPDASPVLNEAFGQPPAEPPQAAPPQATR
ncbi:MAG TPA: hypothetical protein VKU77_28000 [Streptosporangiaceae bacterium]|nr:hypothetical protein [Streptosporangiaceae bacterium]